MSVCVNKLPVTFCCCTGNFPLKDNKCHFYSYFISVHYLVLKITVTLDIGGKKCLFDYNQFSTARAASLSPATSPLV